MVRRHQNAGLTYFEQAIINCYTGEIDDKYFKGNMQKKHYERTRREIDRFVSYICTGRIDALSSTLRGVRQKLTPHFEKIAEEFIAGDFHPNTRCDIRWVTYKYFAWLEEQGFSRFSWRWNSTYPEVSSGLFREVCARYYPRYTAVSEENFMLSFMKPGGQRMISPHCFLFR